MAKRTSILVVDESISLRKTLSFVLQHKGYAVTTVADGLEALERAEDCPFDMILVDIQTPFVDGMEAYRQVRKMSPEAAVMVMAPYAMADLVGKALDAGPDAIIYKPPDIEAIPLLVAHTLAGKRKAH